MQKDKVLVLGKGYIGTAYENAGYRAIGRETFEYKNKNIDALIPIMEPYDIIINCIGITDTKWTEIKANSPYVMEVNALLVRQLSEYCLQHHKKLVHISTGDLYGNSSNKFDIATNTKVTAWEQNVETNKQLDVATEYRFSKLLGERMCHDNDLILRIRLPFDGRPHPKNLLFKILKFTNFYSYQTSFTYVPDLVKATEILINKNQSGIFNVVQEETASILYLLRNILEFPRLQHIDIHQLDHPNLINRLDIVHVHNDINTEKLRQFFKQTPLNAAIMIAWDDLKKNLQSAESSI